MRGKITIARAQQIFNRWIRFRDQNKGCISCGAEVTEAGHYYSAGHHSALRFNEHNVHGQCTRCNRYLHGNAIEYRKGLVKRIGDKNILLLDAGCRNIKKWNQIELKWIIQNYKL
jgi:hypothetical protein